MASRRINVVVSRHSAFYSPLIATISAGFLEANGLSATYDVLRPGQTAHHLLESGIADVMQSAVGSNFAPLSRGETGLPVHFAQINTKDGFFLVGREPAPRFSWRSLEGKTLLADHGLQPILMLQYAARCQGIDWDRIRTVDAGSPDQIAAAFLAGEGDFAHLQGPGAQWMEAEGAGYVVSSVGAAMPEVAFSSLCAMPDFLETAEAAAFVDAYAAARDWVRRTPAVEVAEREASFFPSIPVPILAKSIRDYQKLGCWEGGVWIALELFEQAVRVYREAGALVQPVDYDDIVAPVPAMANRRAAGGGR